MELVFGLSVRGSRSRSHSYTRLLQAGSHLQRNAEWSAGHAQDWPPDNHLGSGAMKGNCHWGGSLESAEYDGYIFWEEAFHLWGNRESSSPVIWWRKRYLEYQQVPTSDPPSYEFLWGPRAPCWSQQDEIAGFLALVHGTNPRASHLSTRRLWEMRKSEPEPELKLRRHKCMASTVTSFYLLKTGRLCTLFLKGCQCLKTMKAGVGLGEKYITPVYSYISLCWKFTSLASFKRFFSFNKRIYEHKNVSLWMTLFTHLLLFLRFKSKRFVIL